MHARDWAALANPSGSTRSWHTATVARIEETPTRHVYSRSSQGRTPDRFGKERLPGFAARVRRHSKQCFILEGTSDHMSSHPQIIFRFCVLAFNVRKSPVRQRRKYERYGFQPTFYRLEQQRSSDSSDHKPRLEHSSPWYATRGAP